MPTTGPLTSAAPALPSGTPYCWLPGGAGGGSAGNVVLDLAPLVVVVAIAGTYLVGARRLARRGRRWSRARGVAFLGGLAVAGAGMVPPLATDGVARFSTHVVQHVLFGMVAPALLVLGAPLTLALQATPRPYQAKLARALHSRPARLAAHPLVALTLFGATLVALYTTPLYELSLQNHLVHVGVHVHFLAAGLLFYGVAAGLDPLPGRLPHAARLGLVLLTVPLHSFVGIVLLSADRPLAGGWYAAVTGAGPDALLADHRLGAGLMWGAGELAGLAVAALVACQWVRADERAARRADARADTHRRQPEAVATGATG